MTVKELAYVAMESLKKEGPSGFIKQIEKLNNEQLFAFWIFLCKEFKEALKKEFAYEEFTYDFYNFKSIEHKKLWNILIKRLSESKWIPPEQIKNVLSQEVKHA